MTKCNAILERPDVLGGGYWKCQLPYGHPNFTGSPADVAADAKPGTIHQAENSGWFEAPRSLRTVPSDDDLRGADYLRALGPLPGFIGPDDPILKEPIVEAVFPEETCDDKRGNSPRTGTDTIWWCERPVGHDGPCAAPSVSDTNSQWAWWPE